MTSPVILVVEDDPGLRVLIARALQQNGFAVSQAGSGPEMWGIFDKRPVDLILLDIMLPGKNGIDLCREVRARSGVPIIFISAKGDETDRVVGLELGADDYLAKPFSPRELLARLRAVLRRANPDLERQRLAVGDVVLEIETRSVRLNGELLDLTGLEFDLLAALLRRAGQVVPRASLLAQAGRTDVTVNDRTVDVHISHLRKKLGDDPPRLIRTVRGVGYVLSKDGE
jgi:two-component system OmpR family response regulator